MPTKEKGVEFDPGFAPYIMAFQGSVQYLYNDINKFKNFSQKKIKFMQYYKKILEMFYNNVGFYVGCIMWASYIKSQPKQKILSNYCYGQTYNEVENTADTDFMLDFIELFPKDMKYFLGQNYSFDENIKALLETYKDFLTINKGFVESEYNTDILLPKNVKKFSENHKKLVDKAISEGNLNQLCDSISEIL